LSSWSTSSGNFIRNGWRISKFSVIWKMHFVVLTL
jgi:hypothetical protein